MATPRTSTLDEAAALVRDQLTTALAALPGGGDQTVRTALVRYLSERAAQEMVVAILDATVPADVVAAIEQKVVADLTARVRQKVEVP